MAAAPPSPNKRACTEQPSSRKDDADYLLAQVITNECSCHEVKLIPLDEFDKDELAQMTDTPVLCNESSNLTHLKDDAWARLRKKIENYGYTPEELTKREESHATVRKEFRVTPEDLRNKRVMLSFLVFIAL